MYRSSLSLLYWEGRAYHPFCPNSNGIAYSLWLQGGPWPCTWFHRDPPDTFYAHLKTVLFSLARVGSIPQLKPWNGAILYLVINEWTSNIMYNKNALIWSSYRWSLKQRLWALMNHLKSAKQSALIYTVSQRKYNTRRMWWILRQVTLGQTNEVNQGKPIWRLINWP